VKLPFHAPVRTWFSEAFSAPTPAQTRAWPTIGRGEHTLLLAPTGSGKTLAAFLSGLDRLMFEPLPSPEARCRILYVSPLKALGVDVERNLRAPIAGIRAVAERSETRLHVPTVQVRSGDTPSAERSRMLRAPPDILITTPESLFLLLTSKAQQILTSVDTVIVDEIHNLVPTKRGAHLFVSLERLEAIRSSERTLQRIGLSATQRPLDEVARLLGGGTVEGEAWTPRPVTVIDAGRKRAFELTTEVPVEDMTRPDPPVQEEPGPLDDDDDLLPSGPAAQGPGGRHRSIWPSIHPRLVELVRTHRSTMIFVNSRRLAERLAGAINEEAGEELAAAHHGSMAKSARAEIEDRLKRGQLPAIVATSSLELGVDMGSVDLVVQVEAPPSVASGMQRIGRSGHRAGATSKGVVFPKFRGDLLACAAVAERMRDALVESIAYPRNPLDVLAQQIVAAVSMEDLSVDVLYPRIRQAAPFADLPRSAFESVLDMLSGRYPSEAFAELKPRITWDRIAQTVSARRGAKRIAVVNGGTIPDRGLYGVFLADGSEGASSRRVGELDEEMVFESRPGDVFLLGATSWRIEDITPDRVLVTPAPGEPGKMPYWHGDRPGRPLEMGRAIGALTRELERAPAEKAAARLTEKGGLDGRAAQNLLQYLADQKDATGQLPTDRAVIIERFTDEIGDWRVCVLSPFGARVHAPWATAVAHRLRSEHDLEVDLIWSDDGMVFRLPEADAPPQADLFVPRPDEVEDTVVKELGGTSLFAAHFRENAARSLLLPRRAPGKRSPLWAQRRKAADLLAVAAGFDGFPVILETYRECLKDVFDLPGLKEIAGRIQDRSIRVHTVDSRMPSPFSASLLFGYVANFIYDGDAPLAERRAQILSIDHGQLRELLGEAELRELLDADTIAETERRLQRLEPDRAVTHADGLHDLLLALGDLCRPELQARVEGDLDGMLESLSAARRVVQVSVGGEPRFVAAELAARYRDGLGVVLPPGLPESLLEPVERPLEELLARFARTRGPFGAAAAADRYGLAVRTVRATLEGLAERGRLLRGAFLPGGSGEEWCDPGVLQTLKRKALARLRKEVEPVEPEALGRFLPGWHGTDQPGRGLDAVLGAIEQLQGAPIPASVLESEVLPARVRGYHPRDLDELCAAGEVMWRGLDPIGSHDGRIALFLTDHYPQLCPPAEGLCEDDEGAETVRAVLRDRGASFFSDLCRHTGAFPPDLLQGLWRLVWAGEVTNDTLAPLRSLAASRGGGRKPPPARRGGRRSFRSRRLGPPGSEGRWTLLPEPIGPSLTERRAALTQQLLQRHGILTREAVLCEQVPGGFSSVYPVLKEMEQAGRIRRGYFIAGLGATQFALPGADERLRKRPESEASPEDGEPSPCVLAATDPANPYGAALPWPTRDGVRPQRAPGALVVLWQGRLAAFVGRTEKRVWTFLPDDEPDQSRAARSVAHALAARSEDGGRRAVWVSEIDGTSPAESFMAPFLEEAGFGASSRGFLKRRASRDA
jgi:ATP-dependent helicase Lhr and Lhr-like helicase